ncbi:MAG: hypothetical protein HRU46_16300 [Verrucomicrobiales bacterium]|nr:hypothetical protein [Verrucomicrobiales bacterium]
MNQDSIIKIAEVMKERFNDFLVTLSSEDLEGVKDVYAGCFWVGCAEHYDYLVAEFSWNTNLGWEIHRKRPSNRSLHNNHRWMRENWEWHPECPHSCNTSVELLNCSQSSDSELQAAIQADMNDDYFRVHEMFIQILTDEIGPYFRNHRVVTASGIAGIPLFMEIDGDEDYPQDVEDALNPNGETEDIFEPW